jgi:Dolichyl-phosphate-mannose-protein mannosyltransferase
MKLEALAALFSAAFTVAASWGAGTILLARAKVSLTRLEQFALAFVLGASTVHLFVFAALAMHVAYKPVWIVVFAALIAFGWRRYKANPSAHSKIHPAIRTTFGVIFAVFTIFYFVNAWAPEISPDGASYHLEIIARYLRAHRFFPIPTNMYADLGQGVELIFAPAFALGRHSAAALVHFAFLIALAMAIYAYGRRIGRPLAGASAALLVYLSPVVARDGTTAYIDVAVAAIVFAVFYFLELWDADRDPVLLAAVGLLSGYAFAAKYTAAIILPYAIFFVLWRSRKLRPAILAAACAVIMCAPWLIKNWIYTRDPVAPFASEIFPSPVVHPLRIDDWTGYLRRYDLANLWTLPIEDTMGGRTQGIIGPVFLLTPLALLALRFRAGRRLLACGVVVFLTYFGNIGTRFLIPCLPFVSLAIALALPKPLLPAIVLLHVIASLPALLPLYANPYLWRIEHFPWRGALRLESREEFLNANLFRYNLIRMVDDRVPRGEPVFAPGSLATSYMSHELIQAFQGALNNTLSDFLAVAYYEQLQPTRGIVFQFPRRAIRRLRLVETAQAPAAHQWNVHELRFFDHGREIARAPEWRVRAHPNPWEIGLAFDNSPVTRWRSWQTGAPGMFIEVDFGREQTVDEVRMETSPDYPWPFQFRVEADGATVADHFEETTIRYRVPMRRAATYELAARGIHYLLIQDGDWGVDDFNSDPESWGLEKVARSEGGTLFKVIP